MLESLKEAKERERALSVYTNSESEKVGKNKKRKLENNLPTNEAFENLIKKSRVDTNTAQQTSSKASTNTSQEIATTSIVNVLPSPLIEEPHDANSLLNVTNTDDQSISQAFINKSNVQEPAIIFGSQATNSSLDVPKVNVHSDQRIILNNNASNVQETTAVVASHLQPSVNDIEQESNTSFSVPEVNVHSNQQKIVSEEITDSIVQRIPDSLKDVVILQAEDFTEYRDFSYEAIVKEATNTESIYTELITSEGMI